MASLVDHLADAVAALTPLPFGLFGHSMGARVAFELARALRRRGQAQPARLYVSAARAPHLPYPNPIHELPDADFLARLREFGGIPAEVLAAPELLAVAIPIVRADFTALETCGYAAEPPLTCAISAFGAIDDPLVPAGAVDAWRVQTTAEFTLHALHGGHFFLHAQRSRLISVIDDDLTGVANSTGSPRRADYDAVHGPV
jgi:medium-chain acyl-[acyl-carrier-protein] hydrolase